jgi:hypothetical protein
VVAVSKLPSDSATQLVGMPISRGSGGGGGCATTVQWTMCEVAASLSRGGRRSVLVHDVMVWRELNLRPETGSPPCLAKEGRSPLNVDTRASGVLLPIGSLVQCLR